MLHASKSILEKDTPVAPLGQHSGLQYTCPLGPFPVLYRAVIRPYCPVLHGIAFSLEAQFSAFPQPRISGSMTGPDIGRTCLIDFGETLSRWQPLVSAASL